MPRQPRKKLTRKRLNNALEKLYETQPRLFLSPPARKMTFFEHVIAGNMDDVKEFLEEEDFNINMVDQNGNGCLWHAIDNEKGFEMFTFLVDNGADMNRINYRGNVPMHKLYMIIGNLSTDQVRMWHYLLDEGAYILPFGDAPLERLMNETLDSLQEERVNSIEGNGSEDPELLRVFTYTHELAEKIDELSIENVIKANFRDMSSTADHRYYVDLRMRGSDLKQFVKHYFFQNPRMNVQLLVGSRELDPGRTLAEQGINEESTIHLVVRLMTGNRRVGGKRKTQRRNRKA